MKLASRQRAAQGARRTLRSFGYAFEGIAALFRTQPNTWVLLGAAVLALAFAFLLRLPPHEVALVCLAIGLVFAAEAANTAVEALADLVSPAFHPLVKRAKDVAASGVLISAMCAVGVALAVFGPRLVEIGLGGR